MLKMMRKNVLVDLGTPKNLLGADLIITPEKYKRIDGEGKIVSIGPKCQSLSELHIGRQCITGTIHNDYEQRLTPVASEALGLRPHWHFIMHEKEVKVVISK